VKNHISFLAPCILVVSTLASGALAQTISYVDPFWAPNVITGLPPALYPAGYYFPGFGAYYGRLAYSPGYSYLCRSYAPYPGIFGWRYGHVYSGACHFPYGGQEYSVFGFDYLTGARAYSWHARGALEGATHEAADGLVGVCRAEVNYGKVTGELRDGNCHVAFEGLEIIRSDFDVLTRDEP
jgi:hypothetical protein